MTDRIYYRYIRAYEKQARQHSMSMPMYTRDQLQDQLDLMSLRLQQAGVPTSSNLYNEDAQINTLARFQRDIITNKAERATFNVLKAARRELIDSDQPLTAEQQDFLNKTNGLTFDQFQKNGEFYRALTKNAIPDAHYRQYFIDYSS